MKATLAVGISASGKSTWAREQANTQGSCDINRDFIRFNIVAPGATWATYKFTRAREKEVTRIQEEMIMAAWGMGQDVTISDTNLSPKVRARLTQLLTDVGYEVELKAFPVTFEEAYKRDNLRANGVGKDILYTQWQAWNDFVGRKVYVPNTNLPDAVIFDIDGTLADMAGKRGPFEWNKVGGDDPRYFIVEMAKSFSRLGCEIIVCSGRDEVCRGDTIDWLDDCIYNHYLWENLFMRKEGDMRKDNAVKEEIFWTHLADKYNIVACVDDRPQMIRLWHELKIPNVIAVANPYIEF